MSGGYSYYVDKDTPMGFGMFRDDSYEHVLEKHQMYVCRAMQRRLFLAGGQEPYP